MTTAKPIARYGAVEGALANGFATAELPVPTARAASAPPTAVLAAFADRLRGGRLVSESTVNGIFFIYDEPAGKVAKDTCMLPCGARGGPAALEGLLKPRNKGNIIGIERLPLPTKPS